MSDSFELTSENGSELTAFASFNRFTFVVKDNWIRAPEVSIDLTPSQARELAGKLLAFAEQEEPTDCFAMGTPEVAHAGKEGE